MAIRDKNAKELRLGIRVKATQKSMLKRAAEIKHLNLSEFVMSSALSEAQRVLDENQALVIPPVDYDWLTKEERREAKVISSLADALQEPAAWDE